MDKVDAPRTERDVVVVRACLRDGEGGSPTAVMADGLFTDEERRALPAAMETSHAVFVSVRRDQVSLRFFTTEEELPACGHGTVAALAVLADQAGVPEYRVTLHAGGMAFSGRAVRRPTGIEASFDPGPVTLRAPTDRERDRIRSLFATSVGPGVIASVGRPRMLVPVPTRADLSTLTPDLDRIRETCDLFGLLGAYVYTVPDGGGRAAARMFAPSIGVPEDIANANSTACLAAYLSREGLTRLTVDMGDSLSSPSTVIATTRTDSSGIRVSVGGIATLVTRLAWGPQGGR